LSGPYSIFGEVYLYPPIALALLLTFYPLGIAWWIVPIAALVWMLWRWHPAMWSWPILAFALAWPRTLGAIVAGNTDIWISAAVATGLVYGWPVALIVIKPTVAPLVIVGIRRARAAVLALGVAALMSLLMLPLWSDYLTAMNNVQSPIPAWSYSIGDAPLLLAPVLAWAARTRRTRWKAAVGHAAEREVLASPIG
jgi:hypothetical protein